MSFRTLNVPVFLLSVLLALVATISLFPAGWLEWRPLWVGLLVIYWVLRTPHRIGMVTAFCLGLLLDVLMASTLGVHALAMSLVAFLVMTTHQRLQLYPVMQQTVLIFLFLGVAQMLVHFLRQWFGAPEVGFTYLLPALTAALCWPIVSIILDGLSRRLS